MKLKRLGALLCTAAMSAMLFGCAASTQAGNDSVNPPDSTSDVSDSDKDQSSATDDVTPDAVPSDETGGKKIAISMPTDAVQRWIDEAEIMKKELAAKGYAVDIQFAQDEPQEQAAQIAAFVKNQADCIVVAPTESKELAAAAAEAKQAQIPVISYDRLLMDTDAVYYYVTIGQKAVGTMIGQEIVQRAGLDNLSDGEYKTVEFFAGSSDDPDSKRMYEGLMESVQPYLDDGRLVCKSGRTSFEDTCIADRPQETAKEWCKNYLAGYYTDEELDICASLSDQFAYGCKEALQEAGYIADNWPIITGQGCEPAACKNILDGTQAFSIYQDTSLLAKQCVTMIESVLEGTETEINDMEQYHNNVLQVPSYLCTPTVVEDDNLKETLIDSGYYTQEQIDNAE